MFGTFPFIFIFFGGNLTIILQVAFAYIRNLQIKLLSLQ